MSVYIGAYVECVAGTRTEKKQVYRHVCKGSTTDISDRPRFCQHCGFPYTTEESDVTVCAVDVDKIRMAIRERLFTPRYSSGSGGIHAWLPNRMNDGLPRRVIKDCIEEIGPSKISRELSQFTSFYGADVMVLQGNYGSDCITLKWGVVTYTW